MAPATVAPPRGPAGTHGGPDPMSLSRGNDAVSAVSRAVDAALEQLHSETKLAEQTERRLTQIARRFASFAHASGCGDLASVTPRLASAFVLANDAQGRPPAVATLHLRRSTLRLVFAAARAISLAD